MNLTWTLQRGYVQLFLDKEEVRLGDLLKKKYNLEPQNYKDILVSINNSSTSDTVKDTLRFNFKLLYKNTIQYYNECTDMQVHLLRNKPLVLDNIISSIGTKVQDSSPRNFNFMTVESAELSLSYGISVQCNADGYSCLYSKE